MCVCVYAFVHIYVCVYVCLFITGTHVHIMHIYTHAKHRHHDGAAAGRFAQDMATHALESREAEPERVLVIVTSQYAWEVCVHMNMHICV